MEEILENILKLVTDENIKILLFSFSDAKIKYAIFSMAHNKSPRPNNFLVEFF